jgi:hypothetical protein
MLNENAVFDTQYVCRIPTHRETEATEAPMHKVPIGNDQSGFVLEGRRNALYKD